MADPKKPESAGKVKAAILADSYAYHEVSGDPSTPRVDVSRPEGAQTAKGVEIEVSQAEFDRGAAMTPPALAKVGSPEAKRALGDLAPIDPKEGLSGLSDADLSAIVVSRNGNPDGMTRDALIGFVAGTPGNPSSNPASTS